MAASASTSHSFFAFEVFGKVQGVYFRKYTHEQAVSLGLKGFVMNTPKDTVVGEAHGPIDAMSKFKHWLQAVGSPKSKITKAVFSKEKLQPLGFTKYTAFDIRK